MQNKIRSPQPAAAFSLRKGGAIIYNTLKKAALKTCISNAKKCVPVVVAIGVRASGVTSGAAVLNKKPSKQQSILTSTELSFYNQIREGFFCWKE